MDRVLLALVGSGYSMTPGAREHLADHGDSMDLDAMVDYVLVAEGFGDLEYVAKRDRSKVRQIIERELDR